MKKIITLAALALVSAGIASAQSFENATNLAKTANEALINGDATAAVEGFTNALAEASQCTEDGAAELVATCKTGLVKAKGSLANKLIDNGDLAQADVELTKAIGMAKEYGMEEDAAKFTEKKQQVLQSIANAEIKAATAETDAAGKAAHFNQALEALDNVLGMDPANGKAYLQKGQVLSALGKKAEAIDSYMKAKENGCEADADKQLSNIYVKEASAFLKAGKYKEAIASCTKAVELSPNANAYKIAGVAAQKSGDIKTAVTNFESYLKLKPGDAQIKAACEALKANLK